MSSGTSKTIPEIAGEIKNEILDFVSTRAEMLSAEMKEKFSDFISAAPTVAVGLLLLITAWFVLTGCFVTLIAMAFAGNAWNYTVAFAIVGLFYLLVGGILASLGWRKMKEKKLVPERTIRTLKQDQVWLQTEVKTQL